jgi:hypothetical protein
MPIQTFAIARYEVSYLGQGITRTIWLADPDGNWFGILGFHPDGSPLPPDAQYGEIRYVNYYLEDYPNCIDLLRNQPGTFLLWDGPGPGNSNGLITAEEIPDRGVPVTVI